MRLLVITQAVDTNHPVLGFFHGWLVEFSRHFDALHVICLEEGAHALPANVSVASLGKKSGNQSGIIDRFKYSMRFFLLLGRCRGKYDAVLVHMNQEYVLLAGWYWVCTGIPVYLWRNHYAGNFLTNLACMVCTKVFCTSRHSYTARFKKTVLMPVGTDAVRNPEGNVERIPRSILSLGRIAPSKNIHLIVEALGMVHAQGVEYTATIRGKVESEDRAYFEKLKERARELGIENKVSFGDAVPKSETHRLYRAHEIFINASPSGMLDKTIFSSSAYGCLVLASSEDFKTETDPRCGFEEGSAPSLAMRLTELLRLTSDEKRAISHSLESFAGRHTLSELGTKLGKEIVA
jgi:glycosyltransferase involved in cell wall biosynthesis